jgi:hypothetical protein
MGTGEEPGSDAFKSIRTRLLSWLPAWPEAAYGLPMRRYTEASVPPPCIPCLRG